MNKTSRKRPDKLSTGKFINRKALEERIWQLWVSPMRPNYDTIAKCCGIHAITAKKVIHNKLKETK